MCRHCRVPSSHELPDLDSFDLAFLTLTGHVKWSDPFDTAFKLMKSAKAHDSKIILWGPEAEMLWKVTERAYREVLAPLIRQIQGCFDTSGDVTVDAPRAYVFASRLRDAGQEMAKKVEAPAKAVIAAILENAEAHFEKQRKMATKQFTEAEWRGYLAEASSKHLDHYIEKYPEEMIHPQVQRMIQLAETSASRRLIDRGVLTERINGLDRFARTGLAELTDVEAGLAWTGTGLALAHSQGVSHYIVQAEEDNRTCPVCLRLNGRKFAVADSLNTLDAVLSRGRRHRFPRVSAIDNISPEEVEGMSLFPPFHPRCRCDVAFLWREAVPVSAPSPPIPRTSNLISAPTQELAGKIQELRAFAKNSAGSLNELVVIAERKSGKILAEYQQTLRAEGMEHVATGESGFSVADMVGADGKPVASRSILHLHTHPEHQSFSEGDWRIFSRQGIGEMRVYTPDGEFQLIKTTEFSDMPWETRTPKAMTDLYNRHIAAAEEKFRDLPYSDEYVAKVVNETTRTMAEELKVKYREVRVPVRPETPAPPPVAPPKVVPATLPGSYVTYEDAWGFRTVAATLEAEGKMDAAAIVRGYKPVNGELYVKHDGDGTIKSFAQVYHRSVKFPDKTRVIDLQGFGDDWLTSRYEVLKEIAKDAIDKGKTALQVIPTGVDARDMKRFGFKKGGKYWEIEGDKLSRFSGMTIPPRPVPPPPPPPITTVVTPKPTPTVATPAPTAPMRFPPRSLAAADVNEMNVRYEAFKYFASDVPDELKRDLISVMTTSLDHVGTEELKKLAFSGTKIRLDNVSKTTGHWDRSDRTIHIGWDSSASGQARFSRKTVSHEFGHAYDWYATGAHGDNYLAWEGINGWKLDEGDAEVFKDWWRRYTMGKPRSGDKIVAQWVDEYEGRVYPGTNRDGLEWFSVNSARYSHHVQLAREFERELEMFVMQWEKGITPDKLAGLGKTRHGFERWLKGDASLDDLFAEATRSSKWQKGVDLYGTEPTDIIRKAYNYTPVDLKTYPKPVVVQPPPEPPINLTGVRPNRVPKSWRDEVLYNHRWGINHAASKWGVSEDEAMRRVGEALQKMIDKSSCWIRRKNHFTEIVEEGRFKTQFETKTSSGCNDNNVRARFEKKAGGYPTDLDPKKRMVYGYISDDADGMLGHSMAVDQYGEVAIRLKNSTVRARATFCYDDSLNRESVSWDRMDEASHFALNNQMIEEIVSGQKRLNHTAGGGIDRTYWEAQYHYGLTLDDVEEVIFPINRRRGTTFGTTEAEVRRHFARAIKKLEERGISYRFLDRANV